MNESRPLVTLEAVRFGEFLRDRNLIDEEQWLAVLAEHWSAPRRRRIGATVIACGFLSAEVVEAEARAFHDDLEIIEVGDDLAEDHDDDEDAASEMITAPLPRVTLS